MLYISQILNFNVEHSDMPIYKTLELNSKNFKKRIHSPILKQTQPTIFFDLLGCLLPQVWQFLGLLYVTQIFVKKATIYENDMINWF